VLSLPRYLALRPLGHFPPVRLARARRSGYAPRRPFQLLERFWTATSLTGEPYLGLTATETVPRVTRRGLFHPETWRRTAVPALVFRLLTPWSWPGQMGTVAADPNHYSFGTRMHVPGHGWCRVEDTGGNIQGVSRVDLYHARHRTALRWGRRKLRVRVVPPGTGWVDTHLPGWLRPVGHAVDAVKIALY
jgi:hypothetical protein